MRVRLCGGCVANWVVVDKKQECDSEKIYEHSGQVGSMKMRFTQIVKITTNGKKNLAKYENKIHVDFFVAMISPNDCTYVFSPCVVKRYHNRVQGHRERSGKNYCYYSQVHHNKRRTTSRYDRSFSGESNTLHIHINKVGQRNRDAKKSTRRQDFPKVVWSYFRFLKPIVMCRKKCM